MKIFILNYRSYQKISLQYSDHKIIKPQDLIDDYILQEISYYISNDIIKLLNLESEEFFKVMTSIHGQGTKIQRIMLLNQYKMKSNDLTIDGFESHEIDFDFELLVVRADELLNDEALTNVYIHSLRPKSLSNQVKYLYPKNLQQARELAREIIVQYNSAIKYLEEFTHTNSKYSNLYSNESINKAIKQNNKKPRDSTTIQCYYCNTMGHFANNCLTKKNDKIVN